MRSFQWSCIALIKPPIDSTNVSISRRPMFVFYYWVFVINWRLLAVFNVNWKVAVQNWPPHQKPVAKKKTLSTKSKLGLFRGGLSVSLCVSVLVPGRKCESRRLKPVLLLLEFCWCDFEINLIQFLRDYFLSFQAGESILKKPRQPWSVSWFERSNLKFLKAVNNRSFYILRTPFTETRCDRNGW